MNTLYRAIDSVADLLRKNIKRDSWLWNRLRGIKTLIYSMQRNPINEIRWKSNYNRFECMIEQYSKETHDFFVLEIGAFDGVLSDPIYKWIKKYQWHGILVEPQRDEFERLKAIHSDNDNLRFENVAIAETSGQRPFYKVKDEYIEADWQRRIASLLPKPHFEQNMVITEMVPCVTFDTLLDSHHVEKIDLLQIDVEGYDYELLKSFNFERLKPQLIRYEHRHLKLSDKSSCVRMLKENGYKVLEMEYDTGAFLRSE